MSSGAIERQVITTWYRPDEKLPAEGVFVVATVSGRSGNVHFDHALVIAEYYGSQGWYVEPFDFERKGDWFTLHAWADLEPYGG